MTILNLPNWKIKLDKAYRPEIVCKATGSVWKSFLPFIGTGAWSIHYNWLQAGYVGTGAGGKCSFERRKSGWQVRFAWDRCDLAFSLNLTEKSHDLLITVEADDVVEGEKNRLAWIDFFPGLGFLNRGGEGSLFFPAHQGILHHANPSQRKQGAPDRTDSLSFRSYSASAGFKDLDGFDYYARIYGSDRTEDMWQGAVPLPYFGTILDQSALLVWVEDGEVDASVHIALDKGEENRLWVDSRLHYRETYDSPVHKSRRRLRLRALSGKEASWQGLARAYRSMLIRDKGVTTLAEREKKSATLRDFLDYGQVRTMYGHKLPDYSGRGKAKVYLTYDEMLVLAKILKKRGLSQTHLTHVGFNIEGHDGCYPTIFPFEKKLFCRDITFAKLLKQVSAMGWHNSFHSQHADSFEISPDFSLENVIMQSNGSPLRGGIWAGGLSYMLCPEASLEFARRDFPQLKQKGFSGMAYIDVWLSALTECHSATHPLTRQGYLDSIRKYLAYVSDLFGGVQNEWGTGATFGIVDYALNAPRDETLTEQLRESTLYGHGYVHEFVPAWEMVAHGIMAYDIYPSPLTSSSRFKKYLLNVARRGALPAIRCENGMPSSSEISRTLKLWRHIVKDFGPRQRHAILDYEEVEPQLYRISYEDGVEVWTNTSTKPKETETSAIPSQCFLTKNPC